MGASEPTHPVSIDRSVVGITSVPRAFEVTASAIVAFAEAVGDPCPAFRSGEIAPPTFPDTFGLTVAALFPALGCDFSRALHGEQEYAYERALVAGDRVTCIGRIVDVSRKRTSRGSLTCVVAEQEARDESGEVVFTSRSTVLL